MSFRLSKRIYKIAEKVRQGESAADIGTDHGYVPMLLMRNHVSPFVIMSDISEGSLAKAKETFAISGIDVPDSCFRTGDGLSTVKPGEVDAIIIGGLGGLTIAGILADDPQKSRSFKKIIMQPRKHSGNLRYYLYTNGWDITDEDLAPEGKFICEIITAEVSGDDHPRTAPYPEDDIRWKYPESIIYADPRLALNRIRWKISSLEEQETNLSSGETEHRDILKKIKEDHSYLIKLEEKAVNALKTF